MSSELTIGSVRLELGAHERICTERYTSIDKSLNELKAMLLVQGSDFHGRLNTISNRMWAGVIGALGMTIIALATVVFYLVTRHP